MAPIPPQIEHKEDPHNENLIDVDGPHVRSIEREFADYTDTQAHRVEREAEDAEITARHEKEKAASKAKELKNKAHAKEQELMRNKDNPVIIGNTAILGIGAVALGYGAYFKHTRGELSGQLVGLWAAGLTAFAVADYYTSQWLFNNKFFKK